MTQQDVFTSFASSRWLVAPPSQPAAVHDRHPKRQERPAVSFFLWSPQTYRSFPEIAPGIQVSTPIGNRWSREVDSEGSCSTRGE